MSSLSLMAFGPGALVLACLAGVLRDAAIPRETRAAFRGPAADLARHAGA